MIRISLLLFLIVSKIFANEECIIGNNFTLLNCNKYISVFYDVNSTHTFTPPTANAFSATKRTSLGYQEHAVWTKLILNNSSEEKKTVLLVNPRVGMDTIKVMIYRNNRLIQNEMLGDCVNLEDKSFYHRYPAVELVLDPSEKVVILARLKNNVFVDTNWYVISKSSFSKYSDYDLMAWSFYYGLLFVLILYSLNNYFVLKNKIFITYSLIAVSSAIQISSYNGFAYMFSPYLVFNNLLMWIFLPLTTIFILLFGRQFFKTDITMPYINKIITFIIYFMIANMIILSISYLFFDENHAIFLLKKYLSYGMLVYFLPAIIGIIAIRKKLKGAVFYTIGQGTHSVSIGYLGLHNALSPSFSFTTVYAPLVASVIDLVFLSFALVQYFKYIKNNNTKNERLLLAQSSFCNIGKSIGHITHQWRHPIVLLGNSVALLESIYRHKNELFTEAFEKQLPNLKEYIKNLDNTLNDFSSFYSPTLSLKEYSPVKCIDHVIHLLHSKIILKNAVLSLNIPEDLKIYGDESAFSNIILVLIDNSLDAFKEYYDNQISITITLVADRVSILYEDNAGGITIEPIENIFEYFVTTKNDNEAHGFGLAIAKLLIEDRMNGNISVKNTSNGVFFKIDILLNGKNAKIKKGVNFKEIKSAYAKSPNCIALHDYTP